MRVLLNIVLGLGLFLFFLVLRLPYDTMVERSVRELEASTEVSLSYTPVSAGPTGVRLSELRLKMPSGARLAFTRARLFPTRAGLRAELFQEGGSAKLRLNRRDLKVTLASVEVETNNQYLGTCRLTGDFSYDIRDRFGKGSLGLVSPNFNAPIPVSDAPLEVGSSFVIKNVGTPEQPRSSITAQINLVSRDNTFSADGPITLEAQVAGGKPTISGNLRFEAPTGRGTLRLGGDWEQPKIDILPQR